MKASALFVATIFFGISGCSVKLVAEDETPSVANTCHASSDCGANATCDNGACVASSGSIDEVLVEVIPDSQSEFGGLSFVSTLDGVKTGDRSRDINLPGAVSFIPQVRGDLGDYPNCPAGGGKQQLAARIEYTRVSSVGGVPILGLPVVSVTVDVDPTTVDATTVLVNSQPAPLGVSLFPGTYDIYVTPVVDPEVLATNKGCEVGPYILRGVVVADDALPSAPHATIDLPKPELLDGTVVRGKGSTLVGWSVDIVEPQEGRLISTVASVGATSMNALTNFNIIAYLPPSLSQAVASPAANNPGAASPLVRLTPPPEMLASAPTVYWELAAADINGVDANGQHIVSLDMTGVPIPDQLVEITGQVTGDTLGQMGKMGVHASLRFFSLSLDGALGLTAVFNPSVVTDDNGRYAIKVFPGQYRVVATPDVTGQDALAAPAAMPGTPSPSGATVASPWAITETSFTIQKTGNAPQPLSLSRKITLQGTALSDPKGAPAMGATFEVVPSILLAKVGVLRSALAQAPTLPPSASVPIVDDKLGAFTLPVDPGAFDLSLRPADTSNFAWWVLPAKTIDAATAPVMARLPLPVPIEGTITIPDPDPTKMKTPLVLRSASVRAYAKVPDGTGVTKVGETRTDDMGHYSLGLPASFGK